MGHHTLEIPQSRLRDFCQRHHIRKLALFGSVLRPDFNPESDVDVLVEFDLGHPVGWIRLAGIERELSELLGRQVDLRTAAELSPLFRQDVLGQAEIQYAAG